MNSGAKNNGNIGTPNKFITIEVIFFIKIISKIMSLLGGKIAMQGTKKTRLTEICQRMIKKRKKKKKSYGKMSKGFMQLGKYEVVVLAD